MSMLWTSFQTNFDGFEENYFCRIFWVSFKTDFFGKKIGAWVSIFMNWTFFGLDMFYKRGLKYLTHLATVEASILFLSVEAC